VLEKVKAKGPGIVEGAIEQNTSSRAKGVDDVRNVGVPLFGA